MWAAKWQCLFRSRTEGKTRIVTGQNRCQIAIVIVIVMLEISVDFDSQALNPETNLSAFLGY
jgi:hypothetical protein